MKTGAVTLDTLVSFCPEVLQSRYSVNLVKKIPNLPRNTGRNRARRDSESGFDEGASRNQLQMFSSPAG